MDNFQENILELRHSPTDLISHTNVARSVVVVFVRLSSQMSYRDAVEFAASSCRILAFVDDKRVDIRVLVRSFERSMRCCNDLDNR